ncbi:hypothetical protein HMSSN036_14790 [Paenibacillus macerans]|nr:hypothetical protein HMSSN036_14790 [Paenibacillus macerans]
MARSRANSPVYKLAIEYKLAFPLHPEYRTLPMVWYVPPLSPIMSYFEGRDSIQNPDLIFPAIEEMRTPIQYLANMLTAGGHRGGESRAAAHGDDAFVSAGALFREAV